MIKNVFWVAVGAAGALQAEKFVQAQRSKLSANAVTGKFLDKVNRTLESRDR